MTGTSPGSTPAVAKARGTWGSAAITSTSSTLAYDPKNFYVRATDARGHGERLSFKVPPDVYAAIAEIVHCGDFPDYHIPADFARDAIVHHLATRRGQIGDVALRDSLEALQRRLRLKESIEQAAAAVLDWQTMEDRMRETLTALFQDKAYDHIDDKLDQFEEYADPIAEPYRSRVLKAIAEWRIKVRGARG